METKYKEPAVKTPSTAQLTEIASQLGFDLGPTEIQQPTRKVRMNWIQNAAVKDESRQWSNSLR